MDSINWEEIRQLVTALDQTSVGELILEDGTFRLTIRKTDRAVAVPTVETQILPGTSTPAEQQLVPTAEDVPLLSKGKGPPTTAPHWVEITSPMVGTFYSAPAPGESDFVSLGERVQKGQTLCIIEAMKLMNELEAEVTGRLTEILAENGQPVEFGQVLMRIDPEG